MHRFDGAEQYFTRAVDFGYSFSIDETFEKWGHDEIVGDYVRLIRTIRPDVIAGFRRRRRRRAASSGLRAADAEAFRAAGDPTRVSRSRSRKGCARGRRSAVLHRERLRAAGRSRRAPRSAARHDRPAFDPLLGKTYSEIGIEARSMHKCQGMSQLLLAAGRRRRRTYRLKDSVIGEPGVAPKDMFDGIDTSACRARAVRRPAAAEVLVDVAAGHQRQRRRSAAGLRHRSDRRGCCAAGRRACRACASCAASSLMRCRTRRATRSIFRLAQKESEFQEALLLRTASASRRSPTMASSSPGSR